MTYLRKHLSYANVVASLALFMAIAGGSAIALQGKNSVDSGDLKKNSVKSADIAKNNVKNADIAANAVNSAKIKNATVGSGDLAANSVGSSQIQDGGVAAGDLAAQEPFHKVGAAGEPAFGNGGQGDCIFSKLAIPGLDPYNAPAFFKDARGIVHLTGAVDVNDGPGGDGACDGDDLGDITVFTLPVGYRPAGFSVFAVPGNNEPGTDNTTGQLSIVGPDIVQGPTTIPAGSVVMGGGSFETSFALDGITFRAAGAGTGLPRRGSVQRLPANADLPLGLGN